ncbi:MAG: hypothetical protein N4A46_15790 [Schleiferiaceae bacterium]|nr:hypothetical protein [Schleiferiaceae bacterium]
MKPIVRALVFIILLTLLDFALRKGVLPIPIPLPKNITFFILYTVFAVLSWFITKRFAKRDKLSMQDLGIDFKTANRLDFLKGFGVGVALWAIVAFAQAQLAGFSWILRPDVGIFNIAYGLLFIFIADLGTELHSRGYALTIFKNNFGVNMAILAMVFITSLRSFDPQLDGEFLLYAMIIPALHTIFFSFIYFKTKRLGASLGLHAGANFITISIFDLRESALDQPIPSGLFQASESLENLSLTSLQIPWVIMPLLLSIATYVWFRKSQSSPTLMIKNK